MVVAGDDSLGAVEERRIDMSADACRREQEGLFLLHLGYQFRLEPSVQGVGETLVAANYCPLRLAFVGGYTAEKQIGSLAVSGNRFSCR